MIELSLIPVSTHSLATELQLDKNGLARCLGASVVEWPPVGGEWDADAVRYFSSMLIAGDFDSEFGPFYVVLDGVLVANAGFFGPSADGEVEIGYSVCLLNRRHGVATAAIAELCLRAAKLGCSSVRARCRPDNFGSIMALRRNGFVETDPPHDDAGDERVILRRALV